MGIKQKFLALSLVVLTICALVLGACSKVKKESSPSSPEMTKEQPVELIWYTIGTPQKDINRVMEEVSKYTAPKIGVTVKMTQIDWGDYSEKMKVLTASGTTMDILFTSSWAFDYVQNARKGAFYKIDDLLKTHGQGIVKTLNPAFLEGSKVDGHNYGVPANKELPAQEVWKFNKNLADDYKLDIKSATTLASLEPLLKTIKEKKPDTVPLLMDKSFVPLVPYDYLITNFPMAVKLDSTELKVVNIFETPELKQELMTMRNYYKAGYISPEVATTTALDDKIKSGKWFVNRSTMMPFADNLWTTAYGYPVVSTPTGQSVIYNWSVMGSMQAISANSKHPEKAMAFLNLLNTDPVLRNMVDSGIEGVHYKKVGDNKMENLPDAKNYDMPTFSLGNVMLTYLNPGDPDNKWDEFKTFNAAGKPSPMLGFNFDTTNVATELAAVTNVKEEFWYPLMTGTVDPEEYLPKAIEKFKAVGLDKIIAEAQKQINAWKARK
ncbi:ABC transporter substrate-binding protein [Paenibacillus sp. GCM10023248]|uniref:ABC transporter substrate-binding protein n=1 Tax=unclassified Paenibacillus TaxID=185978 RepID=UPI002379D34E|nr:ABC transporter substrate-binding protein [Paenibacillus sp. MAHUQ-63]MDD9267189.1 ABC transporter substrate-binding protein [Paenibacillus sp. MAHUQ-63]